MSGDKTIEPGANSGNLTWAEGDIYNFATLNLRKVREQFQKLVESGIITMPSYDQFMQLVPGLVSASKDYISGLKQVSKDAGEAERSALKNVEASMAELSSQIEAALKNLSSDEARIEALNIIMADRERARHSNEAIYNSGLTFKKALAGMATLGLVLLVGLAGGSKKA